MELALLIAGVDKEERRRRAIEALEKVGLGDKIHNRCGQSGLRLPAVSLGLWHNFGSNASFDNMQSMCYTAFDNGITHFDLANLIPLKAKARPYLYRPYLTFVM